MNFSDKIVCRRVVQWANFRSPNGLLYSSPMFIAYDEHDEQNGVKTGNGSHLMCSLDIPRDDKYTWRVQCPDDTFLGITPCTLEIYVGDNAQLYYSKEVNCHNGTYYVMRTERIRMA